MAPVVYYRPEDYLTVMRRLLIDLVDTAIAGTIALPLSGIAVVIAPSPVMAAMLVMLVWGVIGILYFVVWKGSRFRTPGYVLAGARIVNFSGERPGYLTLLGRFGFVLLGPSNYIFDLLWVSSDPSGQALRDKVAHTFVIRKDAVPVGTGRISYSVYNVFGGTLMFAEVRPPK